MASSVLNVLRTTAQEQVLQHARKAASAFLRVQLETSSSPRSFNKKKCGGQVARQRSIRSTLPRSALSPTRLGVCHPKVARPLLSAQSDKAAFLLAFRCFTAENAKPKRQIVNLPAWRRLSNAVVQSSVEAWRVSSHVLESDSTPRRKVRCKERRLQMHPCSVFVVLGRFPISGQRAICAFQDWYGKEAQDGSRWMMALDPT